MKGISPAPHLLLDTHVLVRGSWNRRGSREIRFAHSTAPVRRGEPLVLSAITLIEIAVLFGEGGMRLRVPLPELFAALDSPAGFHVVPLMSRLPPEVSAPGRWVAGSGRPK